MHLEEVYGIPIKLTALGCILFFEYKREPLRKG
jgi:hypothetical protein